MAIESWGRFPKVHQNSFAYSWRDDPLPQVSVGQTILPYGNGRSYGDSCLNDQNSVLRTTGLNRFISLDRNRGVLRCEAGVLFEEILRILVPQGWFLPVTPGTKFITVGGAVANDVHGKNHHGSGTFGHHVTQFELLRSDGTRMVCSPEQNADWFRATIGGLGLTGLMTWVEFKLKPILNPWVAQEVIRFSDLEEFFALSEASERDFEYTVSWIDCLARGKRLGKGLFIRGNHAPYGAYKRMPSSPSRKKTVPFDFPSRTLNSWTLSAFNFLYYRKQFRKRTNRFIHYDPFFYPLDGINHWNRIYGNRGFLQYQCVVPYADGGCVIRDLLKQISDAKTGSFLAVLKTFGDIPSLGLLSFPRKGVTVALDFPNTGPKIFSLLDRLDRAVVEAGGAVYPAKDARMKAESFQKFFPTFSEFNRYVDPGFSSSFWRRVTQLSKDNGGLNL